MITVRQATQSDVATVFELIKAIAKHHDQEHFVVTSKHELLRSGFADSPQFGVLLAELDGKIAGYASYTWNYSIWLGSTYMNIDDVFVWEEFRGKKIGEALMHKAKDLCQSRGCHKIRWEVQKDNTGAIKFYERLGAKVTIKGVFGWEV